jgi:hypothetical protein
MLSRIRAAMVGLFLGAVLLPSKSMAQAATTNGGPGLAVGVKAPAFTLTGQDGREHALSELLVKGKLALVFQRSADW